MLDLIKSAMIERRGAFEVFSQRAESPFPPNMVQKGEMTNIPFNLNHVDSHVDHTKHLDSRLHVVDLEQAKHPS